MKWNIPSQQGEQIPRHRQQKNLKLSQEVRGTRTFCLFYWEQGAGKSKLYFILNSLVLSEYVDVLEESKKAACCQVNTMCLSNRLQNIYISATDWSAIGFGQSSFFCSNSGLTIPQRTGVRDSRVLRHKRNVCISSSDVMRGGRWGGDTEEPRKEQSVGHRLPGGT